MTTITIYYKCIVHIIYIVTYIMILISGCGVVLLMIMLFMYCSLIVLTRLDKEILNSDIVTS